MHGLRQLLLQVFGFLYLWVGQLDYLLLEVEIRLVRDQMLGLCRNLFQCL